MAVSPENTKAAFLMMGAMGAFTVNDTCMKLLGAELPLFQAIFMRGVATVVILMLLAIRFRAFAFRPDRRDWILLGLRSIGEAGAAYFFVSALFNMPLANVTAILQILPLGLTMAGAIFFAEPVGWRRWLAILIGFCGVMLIVRPGAEGFTHYSVLALISVVCIVLRDLATRRLSRGVPSLLAAFCAASTVTAGAGLASLGIDWAEVTPRSWGLLGGATVAVLGGYMMSILTMRLGDISFVSPYRYSSLVFALILGFVVFGDWPDILTFAGAAIVAATGIFTLLRERRIGQVPNPGPSPLRIR